MRSVRILWLFFLFFFKMFSCQLSGCCSHIGSQAVLVIQNNVSRARMFAIFSAHLVKAAAGFISPVKKQQLINTLLLLMET